MMTEGIGSVDDEYRQKNIVQIRRVPDFITGINQQYSSSSQLKRSQAV